MPCPGTHCTEGWVGTLTGLDGCGKSCPPPGFDPQPVQPVARFMVCDVKEQVLCKIKRYYGSTLPHFKNVTGRQDLSLRGCHLLENQ